MLPDQTTDRMLSDYLTLSDEHKHYIAAIVRALAFAQSVKSEQKKGEEGTNGKQPV